MKSAKWLAAETARLKAEFKRLEAEEAEIRYQSTAARLERNRLARMKAGMDQASLHYATAAAVAAIPIPVEVEELRQEIRQLMRHKTSLANEATDGRGAIPGKFIRPDAVEFFEPQLAESRRLRKELADRIADVESKPNQSAGPRLKGELSDLEAKLADAPTISRLSRYGAEIAVIESQVREKSERVQALLAERAKAAVA